MFKIPEFNFSVAERKVKQLQKICVKLGLPVVEMVVKGEVVEDIEKRKNKPARIVKFFLVELLNAEVPKL